MSIIINLQGYEDKLKNLLAWNDLLFRIDPTHGPGTLLNWLRKSECVTETVRHVWMDVQVKRKLRGASRT